MSGRSRRWLWLLLVIPLGLGLARLRFDVEVLNLLPDDVPAVQGLKLYQQHCANARELIITIRAPNAGTAEAIARLIAETLSSATNLVSSVTWQPLWLEHPVQAAELIACLWINQPPQIFDRLIDDLARTNLASRLATAREQLSISMSPGEIAQLSYDPFGLTRLPESVTAAAPAFGQGQEMFASADGTFRILFVQATRDLSSYRDCLAWLSQVKSRVQNCGRDNSSFNASLVGYTGRPAFVAEIAGGMERDMTGSVGFTAAIIAVLFWLAHRRWVPMLWLLTLLALILLGTLALGGLLFGTINVVSLGFAAILLGLAVDYGVVHYQEALASPKAIIPEIRRAIGPSIFWAAVTTISAFLVLNLGGLPGLAQLGSLVALGVALSALVMLFAFLPPLFRDRLKQRLEQLSRGIRPENLHRPSPSPPEPGWKYQSVLALTALCLLGAAAVLSSGLPRLDPSADALRPRHSPAYAALEEIKARLAQGRDPLWLMTGGRSESLIARRLDRATSLLQNAVADHLIAGFTLPTPLWPRPEFQEANRAVALRLASQRGILLEAALAGGFTSNAFALTGSILDTWHAAARTGVFWPTNETSRWILEKMVARSPAGLFTVGFVYPETNAPVTPLSVSRWADRLSREGFMVSGWPLLGSSIFQRAQQHVWRVVLPMIGLVLMSLWLAFRRPAEILLSLGVLCLSGACLLSVMRLAGWSWNLMNLMGLPLMLGAGVDYAIFMQLALRRHNGDLLAAHRSVGRALLLCGGTAVAGFGSLSWSTNAGMASLGQVCAVGIGCNMIISVYLLPAWWHTWARRHRRPALPATDSRAAADIPVPPSPLDSRLSTPSALYRVGLWRLGRVASRVLPAKATASLTALLADLYGRFFPQRRETIVQNLLPPLNGDVTAAERMGRQLFKNFGVKLADLWHYENGQPVDHLFGELTGWEHFVAAQKQTRGVLVLTPHLGNWEFGAPLLARRGVNLLTVTLTEPDPALTALRRDSRRRWGIETVVVGADPFSFIELIRRLESGATVALLVDRPPAASAIQVELFGRPFAASVAPAELARATGCVLLPVCLLRGATGYAAHVLPPVQYDRAALRDRDVRQKLTQEIMRAFEPAIRQHLDQWYHFVPIWPAT